jgi:hypothetical protein
MRFIRTECAALRYVAKATTQGPRFDIPSTATDSELNRIAVIDIGNSQMVRIVSYIESYFGAREFTSTALSASVPAGLY